MVRPENENKRELTKATLHFLLSGSNCNHDLETSRSKQRHERTDSYDFAYTRAGFVLRVLQPPAARLIIKKLLCFAWGLTGRAPTGAGIVGIEPIELISEIVKKQ